MFLILVGLIAFLKYVPLGPTKINNEDRFDQSDHCEVNIYASNTQKDFNRHYDDQVSD